MFKDDDIIDGIIKKAFVDTKVAKWLAMLLAIIHAKSKGGASTAQIKSVIENARSKGK